MMCTRTSRSRWPLPLHLLSLLPVILTLACSSATSARRADTKKEAPLPELLGPVTQERVLAAVPDWADAMAEAAAELDDVDDEAVERLREVAPGAGVTVYFGTWCSDSRREVSRLWAVLDRLGVDETAHGLPFDVRYIGVDRAKKQPVGLISTLDLRYVPTIIVRRGLTEVGRIVEKPLISLEVDLAGLLSGEMSGILTSSRPELLNESVDSVDQPE